MLDAGIRVASDGNAVAVLNEGDVAAAVVDSSPVDNAGGGVGAVGKAAATAGDALSPPRLGRENPEAPFVTEDLADAAVAVAYPPGKRKPPVVGLSDDAARPVVFRGLVVFAEPVGGVVGLSTEPPPITNPSGVGDFGLV